MFYDKWKWVKKKHNAIYQNGYNKGYQDGMRDGVSAGKEIGYLDGVDEGSKGDFKKQNNLAYIGGWEKGRLSVIALIKEIIEAEDKGLK